MKYRLRAGALTFACIGALLLSGCSQIASTTPVVTIDPALRDPEKNSAVKPVPKDAKWMARHEGFVAEAAQGNIDVLFVGDSITDFWRERNPQRGGRAVWDREFAPLRAANFGISADRTQHLLWRLQNGELNGLQPKVVVVLIGTNNTGFEADKITPRNTPEQAIEGVRVVVQELRQRLPKARILLLGLFPRAERPDHPQRVQVEQINRGIEKIADGRNVRFLNFGGKFLTPDGTLRKELMPDFLHPGEKGYELWAAEMKPLLFRALRD